MFASSARHGCSLGRDRNIVTVRLMTALSPQAKKDGAEKKLRPKPPPARGESFINNWQRFLPVSFFCTCLQAVDGHFIPIMNATSFVKAAAPARMALCRARGQQIGGSISKTSSIHTAPPRPRTCTKPVCVRSSWSPSSQRVSSSRTLGLVEDELLT